MPVGWAMNRAGWSGASLTDLFVSILILGLKLRLLTLFKRCESIGNGGQAVVDGG